MLKLEQLWLWAPADLLLTRYLMHQAHFQCCRFSVIAYLDNSFSHILDSFWVYIRSISGPKGATVPFEQALLISSLTVVFFFCWYDICCSDSAVLQRFTPILFSEVLHFHLKGIPSKDKQLSEMLLVQDYQCRAESMLRLVSWCSDWSVDWYNWVSRAISEN